MIMIIITTITIINKNDFQQENENQYQIMTKKGLLV